MNWLLVVALLIVGAWLHGFYRAWDACNEFWLNNWPGGDDNPDDDDPPIAEEKTAPEPVKVMAKGAGAGR